MAAEFGPHVDHAGVYVDPAPGRWIPWEAKGDAPAAAAGVVAPLDSNADHVGLLVRSAPRGPATQGPKGGRCFTSSEVAAEFDPLHADHSRLHVGNAPRRQPAQVAVGGLRFTSSWVAAEFGLQADHARLLVGVTPRRRATLRTKAGSFGAAAGVVA